MKSIYGFGRGGVKVSIVRLPSEVIPVDKLSCIRVSPKERAMYLPIISECKPIE
jgi:hypothetical protein